MMLRVQISILNYAFLHRRDDTERVFSFQIRVNVVPNPGGPNAMEG